MPATDPARERYAVLAIAVWCEPDRVDGLRARLSTADAEGHLSVLGVTTDRQQATDVVSQWLESLCGG